MPSLGQGETTFQDCTLSAPGQYTLIANDTDGAVHLTSQANNPFTITQGFPVKLVFATSPGNGTGGLPFSTQPVVDIKDSSNNVVYGDDSTVTFAIDKNPGGGTLSTRRAGRKRDCHLHRLLDRQDWQRVHPHGE